jgi:hypothetical protein
MSSIERRLNKLEKETRTKPEDEAERQKRLEMIREGAKIANRGFFRDRAALRRAAYLECVGYEGHSAEDLRDENFLYPDDKLPFTIEEDGLVYSTRDGKPITEYHQTLAEVWYREECEQGWLNLIHDEEAEAFYTPDGELALSRDRADLRYMFDAIKDPGEGEGS